jgi:protein-tyrosine phosphatase
LTQPRASQPGFDTLPPPNTPKTSPDLEKTVPPYREIPIQRFEMVANFRDLGGHTTRDGRRLRGGRLFRSGHLGHASDSDLALLAELGVRTVFDFRNKTDVEIDGADKLPDGATYHRMPMPDPARAHDIRAMLHENRETGLEAVFGNGEAARMMREAAAQLVTERTEVYTEFMQRLCEPDAPPALFHCSAGKDRAGWAGSVVLLALGVDEEQVIDQYLLSNRSVAEIVARLKDPMEADEAMGDLLMPVIEVRREYVQASLDAVRAGWQDVDRYLSEGLGIDEDQRARLRANLLE